MSRNLRNRVVPARPDHGWRTRAGAAAALAAVVLAALATYRLAARDDAAGDRQKLPADLNWVPADAAGFVSVRVADLWHGQAVQAWKRNWARQDAEEAADFDKEFPEQFKAFLGVPPTDVERLTVVLPRDYSARTGFPPLVVTTREALDRPAFLKTMDGGTREVTAGGKTTYQGLKRGIQISLLDDRTYVLSLPGPAPARAEAAAAPLAEALRQAAGKHAVVAGFVPAAFLDTLQPDGMPFAPLATSALLFSNPLFIAQSATLVADLEEGGSARLQLSYRKEATAAVAEDILHAMLQTLRRTLARETSGRGQPDDGRELVPLLEQALRSVKVEQEGTHLRVTTAFGPSLAGALIQSVAQVRVSTRRLQSQNNLKQMGLAMHNYHDAYGRFPPAVVRSKDGKPLYSWRVAILPYLEEDHLYRQFKSDEPWDSPHNSQLLARMPKVYAVPGAKNAEPSTTFYQVLVGGGALFEPNRGTRMADITDGTSNTIMIVEAAEPVPWSKPEDLTYSPKGPLPKFGRHFRGGFNTVFADGSVHFLPGTIEPQVLRALITRNGGEVVQIPDASFPRRTAPPPRGSSVPPRPPEYRPKQLEKRP